ncbi:hypothetical protein QWY31_11345 [Cytophagales bacterium LB-30]|uniref:Uncharacterized protein n=1 Tax=Shiella aurantiaca TaxID=3058365 RepID=A0ABT8F833_9BACT|nr:hypothetical protein [Shiella aurantiaca]MDN4166101.1 hypothetical protein [Shiella aurantiaca]
MKTRIQHIAACTLLIWCVSAAPAFSNPGKECGGGKKEDSSGQTQQQQTTTTPEESVSTSESAQGASLENYKREVIVKPTVTRPAATPAKPVAKPSADLAAENPEENASSASALSFNFVFYVLYKFKFSDI